MSQRYFLITGSDEICEVVEQADLLKAVHDMFCCCDVAACDNCYLEAFKEEFKDGVDFEGWKENLEDGWLNVEELPAQPKQLAKLRADNRALLDALKDFVSAAQSWHDFHKHTKGIQCDQLCACIPKARAAIEHSEPQ